MNEPRLDQPGYERMHERLVNAADTARMCLHDLQRGRYLLSWGYGRGCELQLQRGWLTATDLHPQANAAGHLSAHAEWRGPARYEQNGAFVSRLSLPLGEADDWLFGDDEGKSEPASADFLAALIACLPEWLRGVAAAAWEPPAVFRLSEWIHAAGHETAVDETGGLRLSLARKACDGAVRIDRAAGRLRLTLRLGAWQGVSDRAAAAMRRLVQASNHSTRMVRHVWVEQAQASRCEAVVDLTGLPVPAEPQPVGDAIWEASLQGALDGLQLTLDRLGLELDALADPQHGDIVEAFHDPLD